MKKTIIITFALMLSMLLAEAQHDRDFDDRREKMKALKIGYITEQLELTPEEAQVFWPVFNEFEEKKHAEERAVSDNFHDKSAEILTMKDDEVDKLIREKLNHEQRIIDLRKEYYEKLKIVLPVKKIYRLFEAEAGFKKMLLERLQDNPPPQQRPYDH